MRKTAKHAKKQMVKSALNVVKDLVKGKKPTKDSIKAELVKSTKKIGRETLKDVMTSSAKTPRQSKKRRRNIFDD